MKRRTLIKQLGILLPGLSLAGRVRAATLLDNFAGTETICTGPFQPTWESLQTYQTPDWFRDAKFGIWAHWGPQCQPEAGDWYARGMYQEGSKQYKFHLQKYGHPSKFGFKDVINEWKADQWDPEELLSLYKNAGARYFFAMANHHDNFDMYNSKYQKHWNATKMGPRKDVIGGWAKAAKGQGLPFGVSIHAAHAWSWMETSQRSDKTGSMTGIPYDGQATKAGGKGKWWHGVDPQELYAQNHPLSTNSLDNGMIHKQWGWGDGVTPPSKAYIDKFFNRTIDLINQYNPDLLYFDDSQLPMWPISDVGLRIAAHHYNNSIKKNGTLKAVINGKILDEEQRKAMVWDIERGQSNGIEPLVWQTDTCLGDWHYNRSLYENKKYKSARTVIHTLVDVVSKNGNLLLNIPVRGNGLIDELERKIVGDIGRWMSVNSECIYGSRPWKIFGEGPAQESAAALKAQGFNEGKGKPFTSADTRFTTKGGVLYAIVMEWPESGRAVIKSLAKNSIYRSQPILQIDWVPGARSLQFEQTPEGLVVQFPEEKPEDSYANVLKII